MNSEYIFILINNFPWHGIGFGLILRNGKLDNDLAMHCLEAFTVEKTKHERQMVYKLFGCYIQQMMKMIAELVLQPAIWF